MKHINKTFGVFETRTSTWNNGTRNFVGELIQDGFTSIEDAESFLTERLNRKLSLETKCSACV